MLLDTIIYLLLVQVIYSFSFFQFNSRRKPNQLHTSYVYKKMLMTLGSEISFRFAPITSSFNYFTLSLLLSALHDEESLTFLYYVARLSDYLNLIKLFKKIIYNSSNLLYS